MKSDIEILFLKFRDIPSYKSDNFLKWAKEKYPKWDLHHLLGSPYGRKSTDYLITPLEHFEHIEKAHKNLKEYFETYLPDAVKLLIEYTIRLEKENKC